MCGYCNCTHSFCFLLQRFLAGWGAFGESGGVLRATPLQPSPLATSTCTHLFDVWNDAFGEVARGLGGCWWRLLRNSRTCRIEEERRWNGEGEKLTSPGSSRVPRVCLWVCTYTQWHITCVKLILSIRQLMRSSSWLAIEPTDGGLPSAVAGRRGVWRRWMMLINGLFVEVIKKLFSTPFDERRFFLFCHAKRQRSWIPEAARNVFLSGGDLWHWKGWQYGMFRKGFSKAYRWNLKINQSFF